MKTSTYVLAALFFLLAVTSLQATTVYKWRDANGQLHFSDKPPPEGQAETIKLKEPVRKPATGSKTTHQAEAPPGNKSTAINDEQEGARATQEKQQKEQERRIRKQNCKIARQNLENLRTRIRVRRQDPKTGEWVRMGNEERMSKLREYQRKVREYCR